MKQYFLLLILCLLVVAHIYAQDFGFGFDDEETGNNATSTGAGAIGVSIGGEVSSSMVGYLDDFSQGTEHIELGDLFAGNLNFTAKVFFAEGIINLKLEPTDSPISIDEGYLRAYFGKFDIEAGLRKLTWGKADSLGPLDVINPLDYTALFITMADSSNLMGAKIARPLAHVSFRFGQFSKIEGVFVPNFKSHNIASEGKWAPAQMEELKNPAIPISMPVPVPVNINIDTTETMPKTTTINYAQAGLRFTTTLGPADFGAQYYYGRLPQPAAKISLTSFNLNVTSMPIDVDMGMNILYKYNPYHQIGLDYAQVLAGFNIRAELAANITEDIKGDDASVYNPSIAWSLGFDRDVVWGVNVNLQVNESIRLFHDKLGSKDISLPDDIFSNPANIENMLSDSLNKVDIEGGSALTVTRLTAILSKKFLRDELELRAAVVWGIEDGDCLIMPALVWTKDYLKVAFSGGFFAGDSAGQLGQYKDNHFLKIATTYTF